jgi:hypothetical protein
MTPFPITASYRQLFDTLTAAKGAIKVFCEIGAS